MCKKTHETGKGKNFLKKEDGIFTIEASLIFPIILLILVTMIFFSLFVYQKAILHQKATRLAEEVAFVWDNSNRNLVTGSYKQNKDGGFERDGMYWRGFLLKGIHETASYPSNSSGISETKLQNAVKALPKGVDAKLTFQNSLGFQTVEVTLTGSLQLPAFINKLFGTEKISASATSHITDPVEFIRKTDMVLSYGKRVTHFIKSGKSLNIFSKKSRK